LRLILQPNPVDLGRFAGGKALVGTITIAEPSASLAAFAEDGNPGRPAEEVIAELKRRL